MTREFAGGGLLLEPGRVARLTINAPKRRNAMRRAMWAALPEVCAAVAAEGGARVLVIEGAGGAAFSAGADISEFADTYATAESARAANDDIRAGIAAVRALPMPVIAAIRGACFGGGVALALACDLRHAAASARFAVTPARLGLAYSPEDTRALIAAVGPARAGEMLLTGREMAAAEALAAGLVHRLAGDAALAEAVTEQAEGLAALAPGALATIKAMVAALADDPGTDPAALQALFDARFASDEFREGVAAFLEKRRARF